MADLGHEAPLELDPREYVCSACHLVHWAPTGPSWCDMPAK